jgi:hypothetical protein
MRLVLTAVIAGACGMLGRKLALDRKKRGRYRARSRPCRANQALRGHMTRCKQEIAMSFFGKILEKLGFNRPAARVSAPPRPTSPSAQGGGVAVQTAPPKAVSVVDVVAQLEQRAAASPQQLNWKTSIVDLLKLLEIDSSLSARKELATELHCPPELMEDSAKMNVWLHKTVLARIAENGGNVPKDLLD